MSILKHPHQKYIATFVFATENSVRQYTFVLTDRDDLVTASNASAQTYTIPLNSSVAFPTGSLVNLIQIGAGQVTVVGAGGVTLNSTGATSAQPKTRAQYSVLTLIKAGTDTWYATGDVS